MENENPQVFDRILMNPDGSPIEYKPAIYTWLSTLIGLSILGFALIFLFFGLVILFEDSLRRAFLNWAIASILSFIFLWLSGKFVINNFGAKYFTINIDTMTVRSPFGKKFVLFVDDIAHIGTERPNPILELLPFSSPSVTIITYNRYVKIRTKHWSKGEEFFDRFTTLSNYISDDFAEYYHRSNRSFQRFMLRVSQDTSGIVGLTIIVLFVFLAIWGAFAMLIAPVENYNSHTLFLRNPIFLNYFLDEFSYDDAVWAPPSKDFWFGTDWAGRDMFSRVIFGTSWTFFIAIIGSIIAISLVIIFGVTSAYFGGTYDNFVMRIADSLLTFPPFIFLIIFGTLSIGIRTEVPGGYFLYVFTGMAFVTWPSGARIIRSEVKEIMLKEYVIAAKQLGATDFRILFKHIIPKIIPTILVLFSYLFTDIIIGTTLLGFIGFGAESTLTWGSDINKAILFDSEIDPTLSNHWWNWFFPTLALFLLVFGLTLVSDSVRDNLDPYLRGGIESVPYEQRMELGL